MRTYGTHSKEEEAPNQGSQGMNEIVGGTGKYAGIQGNGPWKCKSARANGELNCSQRF